MSPTVRKVSISPDRLDIAIDDKNDMWDARCVCAVLMRRYELLPDADPKDYYWVMKQLVHRRNALVRTKSALLQQFHEQIQYDYPSYKKFFHEVECSFWDYQSKSSIWKRGLATSVCTKCR